MKKFLLFILITICAFTTSVKADMAGPELQMYKAIVINESGAKFVDFESDNIIIIPKGTELIITSEYHDEESGHHLLATDYKNMSGHVNMEDIITEQEAVSPERKNCLLEPRYVFIAVEGKNLYAGPSFAYTKVLENIPKGAELEYNYTDEGGGWGYVEYNNIKGWIYTDEDGLGLTCDFYDAYKNDCGRSLLFSLAETPIYDFPSVKANKITSTIPKNTYVDYTYSYREYDWHDDGEGEGTSDNHWWLYVENDGVKGWIDAEYNFATKTEDRIIAAGELNLYKSPLDKSSKSGIKVPTNTEMNAKYYYYTIDSYLWYMIEYDNTSYWINGSDEKIGVSYYEDGYVYELTTSYDTYLYIYPDAKSEKVLDNAIKKDTNMTSYYTYTIENYSEESDIYDYEHWNYVDYNGIKGWIKGDDENSQTEIDLIYKEVLDLVKIAEEEQTRVSVLDAYKKASVLPEGIEKINLLKRLNNIVIKDVAPVPSKPEKKDKPKYTTVEILYLSLGSALVISGTSLVIVALTNKKKKAIKPVLGPIAEAATNIEKNQEEDKNHQA